VKNISLNKRIIFALDFDSVDSAKTWVKLLKDKIKFYKVGMQLFLRGGFDFIEWLKDQDVDIMLDLKLFDIPRTMDACLYQIGDYVKYVTAHSQCNILSQISEEYRSKILGVTVLTCFDDNDTINDSYYGVDTLVINRTDCVIRNNCAGIVASGREVNILRKIYNDDFIIVTPGIMLDKERNDDQKRIVTIEEAFKNGSDYAVVGRPIYQSDNPIKTVELAQEKISKLEVKLIYSSTDSDLI